MDIAYDQDKFAQALLYVAKRLEDDPAGGAIKVNKALFNADFGHMRAYGRPITGADYQKLPHGPAPRKLLPVREQLVAAGDAELRDEAYLGNTSKAHSGVGVGTRAVVGGAPPEGHSFAGVPQGGPLTGSHRSR